MTEGPITLTFCGPFGLTDGHGSVLFRQPEAKQHGLYLFTVPYERGEFLVSYLGETGTSFARRIKDQMIQTMGGNYRICDPAELRRGRETVIWNGLWRKGTRDKMSEMAANNIIAALEGQTPPNLVK